MRLLSSGLPVSVLFLCGMALTSALPVKCETAADAVRPVMHLAEQEFLSLAEAMPDKLYSFAPPGRGFEGVRTFAEQVKHVACANFGFFNEIEHKTPPEHCEKGGPSTASTKAELLQYLRDSFDYGDQVLAKMNDAAAHARVEGPYWGGNSGLSVAIAAVWHISDHYGQLVPYLRMNGIIPPASKQYPLTVR